MEHAMEHLGAVAGLLAVWAVVVITPGPNFLVTAQHAMTRSRPAGVAAALGVAAGTAVWALAAWLGLSLVLARLGWAYDAIRIAGALYLIVLGLRMIRNPGGPAAVSETGAAAAARTRGGLARSFRAGLVVDLSNPKAATFFTSLFVVMLPAAAPMWVGLATVAAVVVISGGWYSTVALAFGHAPLARAYERSRRWVDRLVGGLFVFFGGRLLLR